MMPNSMPVAASRPTSGHCLHRCLINTSSPSTICGTMVAHRSVHGLGLGGGHVDRGSPPRWGEPAGNRDNTTGEVFNGTQRSMEEKLRLVAETLEPGATIRAVAALSVRRRRDL